MPTTADSLRHHLLVATPALNTGFFAQTVTYIFEHNNAGAMGIVINRPANLTLKAVLSHLKLDCQEAFAQQPIFAGGPVQTEHGFVLHQGAGHWERSEWIGDDIWLTTSKDILAAMGVGRGPTATCIALGYAGWGAGQLEQELIDTSWLTTRADTNILFDVPAGQCLAAAGNKMGIDIHLLSQTVGHA